MSEFEDDEIGFWEAVLAFLILPAFILYGIFASVWDWLVGLFS